MSDETEESWATFFEECAREIPDSGADKLDGELLVDYDLDDCTESIDGQGSMQSPCEVE